MGQRENPDIIIPPGTTLAAIRMEPPENIYPTIVRWGKAILKNRLLKYPETLTEAEIKLAQTPDIEKAKEFQFRGKTIKITKEVRALRSIPASELPPNTIRYPPSSCRMEVNPDLTKAEKALGTQYRKHIRINKAKTYYFQGEKIEISIEALKLRERQGWEVSRNIVRFSPNICAKKVWEGFGYHLSEAEQKLGWDVLRSRHTDKSIPPEIKVLRNLHSNQLPPYVVRWAPGTLKEKCIQKEDLTKMEKHVGRKYNRDYSNNYYGKHKEEIKRERKTNPKRIEQGLRAVKKYERKKIEKEKEFLKQTIPFNIAETSNPQLPTFIAVETSVRSLLYRKLMQKYLISNNEECKFCFPTTKKFEETGARKPNIAHLIPLTKLVAFGKSKEYFHSQENLIIMCRECANRKKTRSLEGMLTGRVLEEIGKAFILPENFSRKQ